MTAPLSALSARRRSSLTVLLVALVSCSSGHARSGAPAIASPAESGQPSVAASPAGDVLAAAALRRVASATRGLHSYAFAATETLGGSTTHIRGRAVRPSGLVYTLQTPARTEQVVRVGSATYRRVPPAPYRRLVRPRQPVDPLRELLLVLARVHDVHLLRSAAGSTFTGVLDRDGAVAAGLVAGVSGGQGVTVSVRVTTDTAAHVTSLTAALPLRLRGKAVTAQLSTLFSGFNRQPPVRAPR